MVNHIRAHGVAAPLQAGDLIVLQQSGVSSRVIQAMQAPPVVAAGYPAPQAVVAAPPPYWGPGYGYPYPYPYPYYYRPWGPPRVGWGVTVVP